MIIPFPAARWKVIIQSCSSHHQPDKPTNVTRAQLPLPCPVSSETAWPWWTAASWLVATWQPPAAHLMPMRRRVANCSWSFPVAFDRFMVNVSCFFFVIFLFFDGFHRYFPYSFLSMVNFQKMSVSENPGLHPNCPINNQPPCLNYLNSILPCLLVEPSCQIIV